MICVEASASEEKDEFRKMDPQCDVALGGGSADDIDRLLAASDTNLRELTHIDFPVHDRLSGFIRSIVK